MRTASSTDIDSVGLAPDSVSWAPKGVPPVDVSSAWSPKASHVPPGSDSDPDIVTVISSSVAVRSNATLPNGGSETVEQVGRLLHRGEGVPQRHAEPAVLRRHGSLDDPTRRRGIVEDEAAGESRHPVDDVLVDHRGDDDLTGAVGVHRRVDGDVEAARREQDGKAEEAEQAGRFHLGNSRVRA